MFQTPLTIKQPIKPCFIHGKKDYYKIQNVARVNGLQDIDLT